MVAILSVIGITLPIVVTIIVMLLPKGLVRPRDVASNARRPSEISHIEIDKMLSESSRGEELAERH